MFRNGQWEVNDFGLESVEAGTPYQYQIAAGELLNLGDGPQQTTIYLWPVQLAHKNWVDIEAFIEAFDRALQIHRDRLPGVLDTAILERTYALARKLRG